METLKDGFKISAILSNFGGRIVSNKNGYKDIRSNYDVKNLVTGQMFFASINYKMDSKKYLNIEASK